MIFIFLFLQTYLPVYKIVFKISFEMHEVPTCRLYIIFYVFMSILNIYKNK